LARKKKKTDWISTRCPFRGRSKKKGFNLSLFFAFFYYFSRNKLPISYIEKIYEYWIGCRASVLRKSDVRKRGWISSAERENPLLPPHAGSTPSSLDEPQSSLVVGLFTRLR
jgi:hypothetical protein